MTPDILKMIEEYEEMRSLGTLFGDGKALEIADDIANAIREMQ